MVRAEVVRNFGRKWAVNARIKRGVAAPDTIGPAKPILGAPSLFSQAWPDRRGSLSFPCSALPATTPARDRAVLKPQHSLLPSKWSLNITVLTSAACRHGDACCREMRMQSTPTTSGLPLTHQGDAVLEASCLFSLREPVRGVLKSGGKHTCLQPRGLDCAAGSFVQPPRHRLVVDVCRCVTEEREARALCM